MSAMYSWRFARDDWICLELPVPIRCRSTEMANVARRGFYHMDINGAGGRGAFDIREGPGRGVPTYPVLWSHDAGSERRLVVNPDSRGSGSTGYAR